MVAAMLVWMVPVAGAAGGNATAPLSSEPVPSPVNIAQFVKDNAAAVKLGKSLFWDMQAGSDGRTACATCHFNAGADNRSRNQLNPRTPAGHFDFGGPNSQLSAADFPLHTGAVAGSGTVVGSQGVIPSNFTGVTPGSVEDGQDFAGFGVDPMFNIGGINIRRTTGRNTPSVINAVFNFRNFWDGRAQNDFNGVDPFGSRDTAAEVHQVDANGNPVPVKLSGALALNNSSLASQAVGPPGNPGEMSSTNRTLADIGKKLL
jgi:cytochrome c peroxidase